MAKQSSVNLDITNNADGFDISGGTTVRKLGITGGDVTIAGSGSAVVTFPTTSTTIAGLGIAQSFSALQSFSAGISASGGVTLAGTLQGTTANFTGLVSSTVGFSGPGTNLKNIVTTFNGLSGAVTGVSSIRGLTGTVGITNGNGIGLSVSGQTMTFSNTGVLSINGGTGAVANVARTNVDNNFSSAQTIDGPGAYLEIVGGAGNAFNLTPGVGILVSDSVNAPQTLQFSQTGTTTTVTLPNYTTTLAGLSGNQTFTALNTFNSGISSAGGTFSSQTRFLAGITVAGGATFGTDISVFGIRVGRGNRGASAGGDTNLAVGANALNSVIPNVPSFLGIQNLAFGTSALQNTTSGGYNSAFGTEALLTNTSGGGNIAFGVHALRLNTSGVENCAFGGGPMYQNTTGSYNTAIGSLAYYFKSTGSNNVAIGFRAGYKFGTPTGSNLTSATNCTLIGNYATPLVNGSSNEIVIGYEAIGKGSNTVSIGNSSITATHLTGVVNIPSGLSAAGGVTLGSRVDITGILDVVGGVTMESTLDVVGVSRFAGGVTFAGTLQGTTGSFSKLLTLSGGLSAAGGITFSSAIVLPLNTAPAITIGTHASRNLLLSCVDSEGRIEVGGNAGGSLAIRQSGGGPVTIGNGILPTYLRVDENSEFIAVQNLGAIDIGDGAGEGNGTYLSINDSATTITATCGSFGVSGRLDMNAGYSEAGATASQATNTITFNAAMGNTQKFVPSAVVNTVNFTNINTASTQCTSATLIFLHGATPYGLTTGTFSVQLAGVTKTVKWSGGSAPVLTNTANKTDILNFLTYDGGTTWLGFVGGLNF